MGGGGKGSFLAEAELETIVDVCKMRARRRAAGEVLRKVFKGESASRWDLAGQRRGSIVMIRAI